ncbi:MAG TPA: Asp-tRNA(Asn)/Glu-tRNA(Gln) amidotransferase GatCAB subunit B, partial [Longimicrobium sp.]|nr:Asp-tRNA(Asn)/Glu-tRNA(Gln) amidotransferase GatCAB subunit B [Longimicrobium sp.]
MRGFEVVIGLEVHVQLLTRTKLFCADAAEYGAPPNTRVCPVCMGLPGALPALNEEAVRLAALAALGLGCTLHPESRFERKSYFYPDLPKGYQITQHERPLATGGWLDESDPEAAGRGVRIRRVHLEEDTGRSIHDPRSGLTALDFNRAGVPLIEIVTEPDLRSPAQARAFLRVLKRLLEYLEVSDCDLEKGSLRVDANVSLRRVGDGDGVPTELKNLNS